jgi:ferredoxin
MKTAVGRSRRTEGDRVKIYVESATCQGHNRCAALAPDLFDIDDNGYASAAAGGVVPDGRTGVAELAADNCPEQAVTIDRNP